MALQRMKRIKPKQSVRQTRITNVDLRRLYLSLTEVFEPWLQLPHQKHRCQRVQVTACGGLCRPNGARKFGGVPNLSVKMRDHSPEPAQCFGRYGNAELRQVALQQGPQKILPPALALHLPRLMPAMVRTAAIRKPCQLAGGESILAGRTSLSDPPDRVWPLSSSTI